MSFLVPAGAIVAATIRERCEASVAYLLSARPETHTRCTFESAQTIGPCTSPLAALAAEIHSSSVSSAGSPALSNGLRSLPSIPKVLLMALTGFPCVSLVPDRRFWPAVLAGLVWTGQAWFAVLRWLASRLTGRKPIESVYSFVADRLGRPEHSFSLPSRVVSGRYAAVPGDMAGVRGCGASWSRPVSSRPSDGAWAGLACSLGESTPALSMAEMLWGGSADRSSGIRSSDCV